MPWERDSEDPSSEARFETSIRRPGLRIELSYFFRPKDGHWIASALFVLVGLVACTIAYLAVPTWQGVECPAQVIRIERNDRGLERPVFRSEGESRDYASSVWSGKSSFKVGQQVTIVGRADGSDWYVKNDPGRRLLRWAMGFLGGVFLTLGFSLFLLGLCAPHRAGIVVGAMAALAAGIPMALLAPASYWLYRTRPNILIDSGDDPPNSIATIIISLVGCLVTALVIWLVRSQWRQRQ